MINGRRVRVLEEDPDLAGTLRGSGFEHAREHCTARFLVVPAGEVAGLEQIGSGSDNLGLLVLRGALAYRLRRFSGAGELRLAFCVIRDRVLPRGRPTRCVRGGLD